MNNSADSHPENPSQGSPIYSEAYLRWKGWNSVFPIELQRHHRMDIKAELQRAGALGALLALEIGFGPGRFMRFAREAGMQIDGIEVNPHLISSAREAGFSVIADLQSATDAHYDLVVAFDVLEHISQEDLVPFVDLMARKLKPQGKMILRFPNGDSPLGLPLMNGDLTHVSYIGSDRIIAIAQRVGLKVLSINAEAQPVWCGSLKHGLHRALTKPLRTALNALFRIVFFPGSRALPVSQNMVVVLTLE